MKGAEMVSKRYIYSIIILLRKLAEDEFRSEISLFTRAEQNVKKSWPSGAKSKDDSKFPNQTKDDVGDK